MKQKILFIILSSFLVLSLTSKAFSFDLKDTLKEVVSDNKSVSSIANIDKKIDDAIGGVKNEVLNKVNKEIKKVTDKIEKEEKKVRAIIADAEDGINKFRAIRDNIDKYIKIAKIVGIVISSGILILIFFLFKVYRSIVSFRKIAKNVANYDDIKKQIEVLEKKVADLEAKK